ncbi:MAG: carbamoyl-phosphate synthase large subunit, partial [Bacteroidota bacterium]
ALRLGVTVEEIHAITKIDPWFLAHIQRIVDREKGLAGRALTSINKEELRELKRDGLSDRRIAALTGATPDDVRAHRKSLGIVPVYKRVDTCGAEFVAHTPYLYSTYEDVCEAKPTDKQKIVILGGGPNRIGQGIEFDYCCVHAAYALDDAGKETIMVNCNPETVSTDYDTSDRLYFEPLTGETVVELVRREQSKGKVLGCIVQFGGQTPLKLAHALENAGIPILGTSPDSIDLAEDRERFQHLLQELNLKQPPNGTARSLDEAKAVAERIGYPVVIRPSFVLGGRAMQIVYDHEALERYMKEAVVVSGDDPVLIDFYLKNAIEVDVDALADGTDVYVAGIMQHIEEAGIHSGDSACSLPPYSLDDVTIAELERQTVLLAKALNVRGLMNVQYAVQDGVIYILEVNPRASRTVPFVAKATGIPIAKIAARVMAGETLASFNIKKPKFDHVAVKEAVFPFARFPGVDIILGPEMKSTGEVMGLDKSFAMAFAKSQLGSGCTLPTQGTVFISVRDGDKELMIPVAQRLQAMGFKVMATEGTARILRDAGIAEVLVVNKVLEGRPHCVDAMTNGQIQLVVNTTEGSQAVKDSFSIRRSALQYNIPHYTTVAGARAAVDAIEALRSGALDVAPLQSYFKGSF